MAENAVVYRGPKAYHLTGPGTSGQVLMSNGADDPPTFQGRTSVIELTIDGGGDVITTGFKDFTAPVPVGGTILGYSISAVDAASPTSGSIVIDVWKGASGAFPTDANSITASAPPTLTTATYVTSTTLTGWTTTFAAGDRFGFNVDSVTSVKKITLALRVSI